MDDEQVIAIRAEYRRLAALWAEAQNDPQRANRIFSEHHDYYKSVRELPEGRAAISGLLDDPNPEIRLLAGAHSLAWSQVAAVQALRDIEAGPGLVAVSAKYTLKSFFEGKLGLDW